ncbi:uncharacterized protein LOC131317950 isoform X2 [Rhododendron vialii]|uniref:uncharacterized protein LOC131317950 isoform X2 n=1 Tax=Rhododendron vialii TaxID=182163 RepID=UPI00265FF37A|nr:uncharacterized protein LOC131317950 isoform X2 [Rhododendron vialii]
MDGADQVDGRTFGANFTVDGVARLRERVNEKLKELMGDYTDDTLVEYVIVLLKNGRRKEEARNELNVFLGDDDSDSFVSWLWDHLGSNLHLYVLQPQESHPDEAAEAKTKNGDQRRRNESRHLDSDSERGKSSKLSRSRHNREWKSLVRNADEPPPFQSSGTDSVGTHERAQRKISQSKRSPPPQPLSQKKRSRPDEQQETKVVASQATVGAPRRLLQFAVRDAVATSRPSSSASEPALKRLRSVVSTSSGDPSVEGHPRRIRSVARVPNAIMATAIKAVEEAAKDVAKSRSSGNVFDRLGGGMHVSQVRDELAEFEEAAVEDGEYGDFNQVLEGTRSTYLQRSKYAAEYVGDMTMLETETGMASDSASDNEVYDDVNVMGRRFMDVSQTGTSGGNKGQDSLMVQYSVAEKSGESTLKPRKDQDQPAPVASNSRKIVNISVNVNTWKPPHYQEPREVSELDGRKSVPENEAGLGKSGAWLMKENNNIVSAGNGNAKPAADSQKESQKMLPTTAGLYSTGRPTEDPDSRTIFVNNVHFAATKDSLSRHFNKFGDVLKVVIVTDAATGQPKGSAYVEFMRKEAAENALSLDGTSFMSRILKVIRKSSAHQEAAPVMTWPRVMRGSMFAPPRFGRAAFPRGVPSIYRGRPPIKPGARSLQWKRDESGATASISSSVPSPTARSLTYVRPEPKANGSSAAS